MLKKILGYKCSTATLGQNNKLILSLENALTPAMWVIDLNESQSLLFKVVETDEGLFALQKIAEGPKGRTIEDLAFYSKKSDAMDAMTKASLAMSEKVSQKSTSGLMKFIRALVNILAVIIVLLSIALYLRLDATLINWINGSQTTLSSTNPTVDNATQPSVQPSSNPNDIGVPLSADDFFNNQSGGGRTSGLPF
jgi:hypothetical protein